MSDRINWIEYKGKKILQVTFSGLSGKDLANFVKGEMTREINNLPYDKITLQYSEVVQCKASDESLSELKKISELSKSKIKKHSCIGLSTLQMVLLKPLIKIMNMPIEVFKTREEALDYLIKD